ncbi:anaphase promoting complex (APC) subunit 2, partial [Haematococcus lacustris]
MIAGSLQLRACDPSCNRWRRHSSVSPGWRWEPETPCHSAKRHAEHAGACIGPAAPKVKVQLSTSYKCDADAVIKVVGNAPELGGWDASAAEAFHQDGEGLWRSELQLAPGKYEFKVGYQKVLGQQAWLMVGVQAAAVMFKQQQWGGGYQDSNSNRGSRDKASLWEPSPNRVLQVPETCSALSLDCQWGDASSAVQLTPASSQDNHTSQQGREGPAGQEKAAGANKALPASQSSPSPEPTAAAFEEEVLGLLDNFGSLGPERLHGLLARSMGPDKKLPLSSEQLQELLRAMAEQGLVQHDSEGAFRPTRARSSGEVSPAPASSPAALAATGAQRTNSPSGTRVKLEGQVLRLMSTYPKLEADKLFDMLRASSRGSRYDIPRDDLDAVLQQLVQAGKVVAT